MIATPAAAVVLAAGDGTRMKSRTSKMLHAIGGRTLVAHAMLTVGETNAPYLVGVVRAHRDAVAAEISAVWPGALIADQDDIPGTGRATECALNVLPADLRGTVLVTYGDTPLLASQTLLELTTVHESASNAVTVLTARVPDPTGYGRIVRDAHGVRSIVEHKDAVSGGDQETLAIDEINSGTYAFDAEVLRSSLKSVSIDNIQGEKYLTDVLGIARGAGARVDAHIVTDTWQIEGVNNKVQLAAMEKELNRRTLERLMREQGVIVADPATTWVDVGVSVGSDTRIDPGCQLLGTTTIGVGCTIGPDVTLKDTEVHNGASVIRTHAEFALIGEDAAVGPFSYLRAGTTLGKGGKIGGFVETKNAQIGDETKVPHLTYCGDATIGKGVNIGAGTIFANYDGVAKYHIDVGAYSFVGSNSVIVAPCTIGDGVYVAAGSVVVNDIEPGYLGVTRAQQRNVDGWVARRRTDTKTHEAAEAAKNANLDATHQYTKTEDQQGDSPE